MNNVTIKANDYHIDFQLKENDKTVLKLKYKNDVHVARIETENEQRVLMIEDEGLLRKFLVLKNEYGVRIGSLNYNSFSTTNGNVDIENTRYRFSINQLSSPELKIYRGSRRNLIYSCLVSFDDNYSESSFASLVIAVSWYLFLKDKKSIQPSFHEAVIL